MEANHPLQAIVDPSRIPVGYVRAALLAVFLALSSRVFQYFPHGEPIRELWLVIAASIFACVYIPQKLLGRLNATTFELYVLLLLVVPVVSSIQAWREFGQPLAYGLLAERGLLLTTTSLFLFHLFRQQAICIEDVERALISLAWFTLLCYTIAKLTLDPARFSAYDREFVTYDVVKGYAFKFNSTFVVFGFLYYGFCGWRLKSFLYASLALPFLVYLVIGDGGRAQLVALVATYLFFMWRWNSLRGALLSFGTAVFVAALLLGAIHVIAPDLLEQLYDKFQDAFRVVFEREISADPSANARIFETFIALPYIANHWALGNGTLSHQWQGGYEAFFGYFYPSDIGLIGVVYCYGLLGALFFAAQFIFALSISKARLNESGATKLAWAVRGFLLFLFIRSIANGAFVFSAETGLIFVAIMYGLTSEALDLGGRKRSHDAT